MPDATQWTLFLAATVVLLLIPGPSVLYVIARGADQGFRAAIWSAIGLAAGDLLQVGAAVLGLSVLLASSVTAFIVVKYVGAAYLIWLGIRRLLDRSTRNRTAAAGPEVGPGRLVRQGLMVNALNPKTALFYLAILPQFVDSTAGPAAVQIGLFGTVFVLLGAVVSLGWGRVAGAARSLLANSRRFRSANRYVGGGTMIVLGVGAALADPPRNPA